MITFHRVLISTAIAFCAAMIAWEFAAWRAGAGASALALAGVFALAGIALAFYLINLHRFLHR
jgi:hypothetical protein